MPPDLLPKQIGKKKPEGGTGTPAGPTQRGTLTPEQTRQICEIPDKANACKDGRS